MNNRKFVFLDLLFFLTIIVFLPPISSFAGTVHLPQTGQTTCYNTSGSLINCAGTGQDGDKRMGVAWSSPRFTDNGNGTVTDKLTGLIWLKNANCTDTSGGIIKSGGTLTWDDALTWSNDLASGACGLSDGSAAGAWRMPNRKELQSLVNRGKYLAADWLKTSGFTNVQYNYYWSSSTCYGSAGVEWVVDMTAGFVCNDVKTSRRYVWPVRGGQ